MANTEELKRKRRALKSKVTIFSKFLAGFLDQNTEDISEVSAVNLKERCEKFEPIIDEYSNVQTEIECSITAENIDELLKTEDVEREAFEEQYYKQLSIAKELLSKLNKNGSPSVSCRSRVPSDITAASEHDNLSNSIQLPKISLPTFCGKNLDWLEYRDTYESLIHNNENLSAIQKFYYLRASLEGPPADIIKTMEFSAQNYGTAWKCITERYNCPRLLIDYHIKALLSIDVVKRDSSTELRGLLDTLMKNLRALKQLGQPTDNWDVLIIALSAEKLDKSSKFEWEKIKTLKNSVPTFEEFKVFLKDRAELLESLEQNIYQKHTDGQIDKRKSNNTRGFLATEGDVKKNVNTPVCQCCKGPHYIQSCSEFLRLSIDDRSKKAMALKLCVNCLRFGHYSKVCRNSTCRKCHRKHHTLLHAENGTNSNSSPSDSPNIENITPSGNVAPPQKDTSHIPPVGTGTNVFSAGVVNHDVLLSTAFVSVFDINKKQHTVRILLDCGAQSSFISKSLCDKLCLPVEKTYIKVKGLNQIICTVDFKCNILIESLHYNFSENIACFVLPEITENLPNVKLEVSSLDIPVNLKLADPTFYLPGKIDMIIGADLFWRLICNGQHVLGNNKPVMQKTRLGWIVSGPLESSKLKSVFCNFTRNFEADINSQLSRFWEIEECNITKALSPEELSCENHFTENVRRLPNGRFVVALPLKDSVNKLGDSYTQAKNRFLNLEKNRLQKDNKFKELYCNFMKEYLELGHMKKIIPDLNSKQVAYYLPHHGVLRENSLTTKLRTVFDASAPSTSGYSLNHLLMNGPILQENLFSILIRFRQHSIVVTADIEKMYRNVNISEEYLPLQRIVWRNNPDEPLETYELQTVTYGTTAGSYLAIRCLFDLAALNEQNFPELAAIIRSDFYVDDVLTGSETAQEVLRICNGISNILQQGCFNLRKFVSNSKEVLEKIPGSDDNVKIVNLSENENSKTLGLVWNPSFDKLMYEISTQHSNEPVSKREILSRISQIFDPLGLLSPSIIVGKILLQKLWLEKLSWDESLPLYMHTAWTILRDELPLLNTLEIPRHVICSNPTRIELHGFSDASEKAYGGCLYVRSIDKDGKVFVKLLCAKSKVCPLKTITMPRLELCAAFILSKLTDQVVKSMRLKFHEIFLWSDSTVVLGWLKTEPSRLQPFVSNRVSQIQQLTSTYRWNYVPTSSNPADVLSRGIRPSDLQNLSIWWSGPVFLLSDISKWPKSSSISAKDLPDIRKNDCTFVFHQTVDFSLLERFSSLHKLKRVVAYILRWKNSVKKLKSERETGILTLGELNNALQVLLKICQRKHFLKEITSLENNKPIPRDSKILNLNPFLDIAGLLRVGGRIRESNFNYQKRHPAILPEKDNFTKLILNTEHLRLLHCGSQQLLANIRNAFWPINGRNQCKQVIKSCTTCYRYKTHISKPIMGELPSERLNPRQPFDVVGLDYAGPILTKEKIGRSGRTTKSYICLFVCFVTKAIHLELVSDLSKDAFIMALRRFSSRRGCPSKIFSDNGKNFVAANSELQELGKFITKNKNYIEEYAASVNITWKFIPPYSPHFGGLWEAGVRSTKHHLKRVIGDTLLTFEGLYTLLVQVESVLNSRPLSPLSSDPDDLVPLTPAHFLVGKSLTSVPEYDVSTIPQNRLSLYQHIQYMKLHFWKRWSKEFVSELQTRTKWKTNQSNLKENTLVVIKEDNLSPAHWKLGRIIQTHPGKDGVPRVATIKTASGEIKRGFQKICPLPEG